MGKSSQLGSWNSKSCLLPGFGPSGITVTRRIIMIWKQHCFCFSAQLKELRESFFDPLIDFTSASPHSQEVPTCPHSCLIVDRLSVYEVEEFTILRATPRDY